MKKAIRRIKRRLARRKYLYLIIKETHLDRKEIAYKMDYAKNNYGVNYKSFYKNGYVYKTLDDVGHMQLVKKRKANKNKKYYVIIEEKTGKTRDRVNSEIDIIKEKHPEYSMNLAIYFKRGLFLFDPVENAEEIAWIIREYKSNMDIKKQFEECWMRIDKGATDYNECERLMAEFAIKEEAISSDAWRELLIREYYHKDDMIVSDKYKQLGTELEVSNELLGFSPSEYAMYEFEGKSLEYKLSFVSNRLKGKVFKTINESSGMDVLDNKYSAYKILEEYYGRKMIIVPAGEYKSFERFARDHVRFVKKVNFESLGRGVELVEADETGNLKQLYKNLSNGKELLLEELIQPHPFIEHLNKSSINTVRITTFVSSHGIDVQDAFIKIGRSGSFVDNGGAGGIIVHLDKETGKMDSVGIDENANRYEKHPDHGYDILGQQLPLWNEAVAVAVSAADKLSSVIEGIPYVGWDLTLNDQNKWIIVEGNCKTQFIGQQATVLRGQRRQFLEAVEYYKKSDVVSERQH